MTLSRDGHSASALQAALAQAAIAAQRCLLAAQRADLEGHDLLAAVLRSVAEGHGAHAQTLIDALDHEPAFRSRVRDDLGQAIAGATDIASVTSTLADKTDVDGDMPLGDTLRDIARQSARLADRLRSLLPSLTTNASG